MSLESLLDELLVPRVPPKKINEEPLDSATNQTGSPSSLGSPENASILDQPISMTSNDMPGTSSRVHTATTTEDIKNSHNDCPNLEPRMSFSQNIEIDRFGESVYFIERGDGSWTIDPDLFIDVACRGLPVNRIWVYQLVIDTEDIEDIRRGDLPLACLRAHIENHLERQQSWQARRQHTRRIK